MGNFRSNCSCGAMDPCTSQYSAPSTCTSVAESADPAASGTVLKSKAGVARAEQEICGGIAADAAAASTVGFDADAVVGRAFAKRCMEGAASSTSGHATSTRLVVT
jgi:hypothetical protein